MRQIWISKSGPPEVLVIKEAPDPHPAAGELRIRVEACGVNFADIMGRLGLYPDLPRIPVVPGYEVAGRVDAAGDGVDVSWVGRDVFASTRFGYADVVCAPQAQTFQRPPNMSAQRALDPGELPDRLAADCGDGRIEGGRDGASSFRRRRRGDRCDPDRKAYRREGHRNGVRRKACGAARARRRSPDRLSDRGLREARASDHWRTGVELILDAVGGDLLRRVTGSSPQPAASACSAPRRPRPARARDTWGWCRCWRIRHGSSSIRSL